MKVIDLEKVRAADAVIEKHVKAGTRALTDADLEQIWEGTQNMKEAFTIAEAAEVLGMHAITIRRAIKQGRLKAAKLGKDYRISKHDLEAFYQSQGGDELFASETSSNADYVWEKMGVAISCLCDDGSFKSRLANATISALMRLNDDDLKGELAEDLKFILKWTKYNMTAGIIQREPDELEKKELIEKMLHVLFETSPKRAHRSPDVESP